MAAAAYMTHTGPMELPDLLTEADLLREVMATRSWALVQAEIDAHRDRSLARLLNETTKAEDIPRLRGLVAGLGSMREAAESILTLAEEREAEARKQEQFA